MAGGRVFGGSNMAVILQNEGISSSAEALHTLLFSSSSPNFSGSRTMVHFQDVHAGKKTDRSFLQLLDQVENGDEDMDECFHQPEKKRRLTTDQVQFLEKSFEVENKLEPERKIQLAKDLGLQPRQVAIWFQNRRARWKTKQLEKDYEALKASYNSLKSDCDNLLKEKDKLKDEIDCLNKKLHLKEEGKGNSDQSNPDKPSQLQSQKPILDSTSEAKESSVPIVICKQEDLSSARSDIFDSADSSQVVEPDLSDISQDEEDNLSNSLFLPSYSFPKLEDADYPGLPENSCNLGFPVGDQPLWFWSN